MSNTEKVELLQEQQQLQQQQQQQQQQETESWDIEHFISLPSKLQKKILSYLNVQTHIEMRKLNEIYKMLSDQYWQNELKKIVFKAQCEHRGSEENAVLQALKISGEIFNQNGYASIFWDCFLPYLFGGEKAHLQNINQEKFQNFLINFYIKKIKVYTRYSQYLRALNALTILQLLKCFPTSEITLQETETCLQIHIEIDNIWLGTTFEFTEKQKLDFIPVALTMLFFVYSLKRTAAFEDSYDNTTYTYGYEYHSRHQHQIKKTTFTTMFDIIIEGEEELLNHVRTWLTSSYELAFFPQSLFCEDDFSFRIKIQLEGRIKNYWPQQIFVKL